MEHNIPMNGNPIKCDTCIYLGSRHNQGVIHIQSGVLPLNEPYATCLKRQYFVLEREVEKCQDYKETHDEPSGEKAIKPYSYVSQDILDAYGADEWLSLQEIQDRMNLTKSEDVKYLPLKLKSMLSKKRLKIKFGAQSILYKKQD